MPTEDLELIDGTRLAYNAKEMDNMPIWPCEQCDGTGWAGGARCACREEDDAAAERRRNFLVISREG